MPLPCPRSPRAWFVGANSIEPTLAPDGAPGAARPVAYRIAHGLILIAVVTAAGVLGGCAMQPPAPWERGMLARPEMAVQPDALQARMQESIYYSRENAAGGGSIGGGGCGCN
jgi:hypothetical protein